MGGKSKKTIPVAKIQPETHEIIAVYESLTEATKATKNAQIGNISRACRGILHTHKGFEWRYLDLEELRKYKKNNQ